MTPDVERWLAERTKEVPAEFRRWLEPLPVGPSGGDTLEASGVEPPDLAGAMARRGIAALSGAAARPGRDREAAFRLLAADAYLTYASEATLEAHDPEAALRALIRRVAKEAE